MKRIWILLVCATLANPVHAGSHSGKKEIMGCVPSANPNVPPCHLKDAAPEYFPEQATGSTSDTDISVAGAHASSKGTAKKSSKASEIMVHSSSNESKAH